MFPRYNKPKYTLKLPKEKMPYEKRALIKSAVSACLVSLGIIMSFFSFCPRAKISDTLYTTYGFGEWKALAKSSAKAVKTGSFGVVKSYSKLLKKAEKAIGINDEPKANPTAKAKTKTEDKEITPKEKPIETKPKVPDDPKVWTSPLKTGEISSPFGEREHPINKNESLHTGVDIAAPHGETVVAAFPGYVVSKGYDNANGYYAVVEHEGGFTTVYAHLSQLCIIEGEYVSQRIKIGEVGSTGISTGPHLHFEIKKDGKSVNPEDYVKF